MTKGDAADLLADQIAELKAKLNSGVVQTRHRRHRLTARRLVALGSSEEVLDIDELHMSLIWRDRPACSLELGDDGLRLRSLAHDGIAQRNIHRPRCPKRSNDNSTLNANLDEHDAVLHPTLAGGLPEGDLVAQVAGGGLIGLCGECRRRCPSTNVHAWTFNCRRGWSSRCRLTDAGVCSREEIRI